MPEPLTTAEIEEIRERCEKATAGPWRSMRDGNQYIDTKYVPTAKCVGASRVEGLVRPWNPHAAIAFGLRAEQHEVSRFLDADADFIAAARSDIPRLISHSDWQAKEIERLTAENLALQRNWVPGRYQSNEAKAAAEICNPGTGDVT